MKEIEAQHKAQYTSKAGTILMFRYLSSEALDEILAISSLFIYDEEERIITEGETSPFFYAVLEGCVNVMVQEAEDKEVYISTIGEGECFGEAGIFLTVKRTAAVVSAQESVILRIHREDLLAFIKAQPASGIKMLMVIVYGLLKKLRSANQELAFERKSDVEQDDIDSIVDGLLKSD